MSEYNGWKNYETWNVALWLGNDEGLYHFAREFKHKGYRALALALGELFESGQTRDGVQWLDSSLDYDELDRMLLEDF